MKRVILGTAGHIDHGKTSLVRALTGIETDRLKEEQIRGITIELGFAWLNLASGYCVGIVDVPGHEKFIKHMVAGASGIDIVAMVIAADEGVMPQTREHMGICTLLGIEHGLVVLTKIDMVDNDWLDLVTEDVREYLSGTFLKGAPIVKVSSVTGEGLEDLRKEIESLCELVPARSPRGFFRLPADRVFTMKGFGTVVTGSMAGGSVRVGDIIAIYPSGVQSKVRGLQVHNEMVEEAFAGMRAAINFQGLDKEEISRGNVVARSGSLKPSYMVDTLLDYVGTENRPLKHRAKIRFYTGTSEVDGQVILLDRDEVKPGNRVVAQFRLSSPLVVVKDDRFVIRSYSPVRTIGGGRIIDPIASKHKRFQAQTISELTNLATGGLEEVVLYHAEHSDIEGISFADLILLTNAFEKDLEQTLQRLCSRQTIVQVDRENRIFLEGAVMERLRQVILDTLEHDHRAHPLKPGMTKEALRSSLPSGLSVRIYTLLMNELAKAGEIAIVNEMVRLTGHKVELLADQNAIRQKIALAYLESRLEPPYFRDLAESLGCEAAQSQQILSHMLNEGAIIKVKEDLFFHGDVVAQMEQQLISFIKTHGEITTAQLKSITGVSRKYTLPLIEYFDKKKLTIRIGDVRKLRGA